MYARGFELFLPLLLAGCGAGPQGSAGGATTLPPTAEPPLRAVEPGLTRPEPVPWQRATLVAPNVVDLYYVESRAECRTLADVDVTEHSDRVVATVVMGVPAGATGACSVVGVPARTRVTLATALGDRTILDGSAMPPAEREVRR